LTEGIVLLDKPTGQTSFQSLGELKRRLGTRRVGHAGTLDKFAEGLLVVLAGRMTRLCAFATSLDKEYIAEITWGMGTDTLDPEGAETERGRVPSREEIEAALPAFRGSISQVPPIFSAVHVGGRRAYEAARKGEQPVLEARMVRIDKLEIVDSTLSASTFRVSCSKGTYIRSLARDIARSIGTCAHVSGLRRIRIGGFRVEDAVRPEDFDPETDVLRPGRFFDAAPELRRIVLLDTWSERARTGAALTDECFSTPPEGEGIYGAFSPAGDLVAVLERSESGWRYAAAFPTDGGEDRSGRARPSEFRQERTV